MITLGQVILNLMTSEKKKEKKKSSKAFSQHCNNRFID